MDPRNCLSTGGKNQAKKWEMLKNFNENHNENVQNGKYTPVLAHHSPGE